MGRKNVSDLSPRSKSNRLRAAARAKLTAEQRAAHNEKCRLVMAKLRQKAKEKRMLNNEGTPQKPKKITKRSSGKKQIGPPATDGENPPNEVDTVVPGKTPAPRNILTLEDRVRVIRDYDRNMGYRRLARIMNCCSDQIVNIIRNRDSILRLHASSSGGGQENYTRSDDKWNKIDLLSEIMFEWLLRTQARENRVDVTGNLIRAVALDVKNYLMIPGFSPSTVWLQGFMQKYRITEMDLTSGRLYRKYCTGIKKNLSLKIHHIVKHVKKMRQNTPPEGNFWTQTDLPTRSEIGDRVGVNDEDYDQGSSRMSSEEDSRTSLTYQELEDSDSIEIDVKIESNDGEDVPRKMSRLENDVVTASLEDSEGVNDEDWDFGDSPRSRLKKNRRTSPESTLLTQAYLPTENEDRSGVNDEDYDQSSSRKSAKENCRTLLRHHKLEDSDSIEFEVKVESNDEDEVPRKMSRLENDVVTPSLEDSEDSDSPRSRLKKNRRTFPEGPLLTLPYFPTEIGDRVAVNDEDYDQGSSRKAAKENCSTLLKHHEVGNSDSIEIEVKVENSDEEEVPRKMSRLENDVVTPSLEDSDSPRSRLKKNRRTFPERTLLSQTVLPTRSEIGNRAGFNDDDYDQGSSRKPAESRTLLRHHELGDGDSIKIEVKVESNDEEEVPRMSRLENDVVGLEVSESANDNNCDQDNSPRKKVSRLENDDLVKVEDREGANDDDDSPQKPLKKDCRTLLRHHELDDKDSNDEEEVPRMLRRLDNEVAENSTSSHCKSIDSYKEAMRHLKPLEEFVLLKENFRAIGVISQLEAVFQKYARKLGPSQGQ